MLHKPECIVKNDDPQRRSHVQRKLQLTMPPQRMPGRDLGFTRLTSDASEKESVA